MANNIFEEFKEKLGKETAFDFHGPYALFLPLSHGLIRRIKMNFLSSELIRAGIRILLLAMTGIKIQQKKSFQSLCSVKLQLIFKKRFTKTYQ